ncbi:MAG: hypothetical protein ACYC7D_10740 [Nitrososphaerales archaeon]
MPKEIKSSDQFQKLLPKAHEVRVVRTSDYVKLKIRTPDVLYTYKTSSSEAEDLLKDLKDIEIVELSPVAKGKKVEKTADKDAAEKTEGTSEKDAEVKEAPPAKKKKAAKN